MSDNPTIKDGLAVLFENQETSLVPEGTFEKTDDFVNELLEKIPANTSLADVDGLREELMQQFHSRDSGVMIRDFIANRNHQAVRLAKIGPDIVLELIAAGMPQSRLCKQLNVSPAVLDKFLEKTCTYEQLRRAEELLADALIEEGREGLENADEQSKAGVSKATEIAKNNLMIAKALSNKYVDKKVDTQINQQFNGLDTPIPEEGEEKKGWLRIVVPDAAALPPLKEVKDITKKRKHEEDPANIVDGAFQISPDEPTA